MDAVTTAAALQAATPFKVDNKIVNFIAGGLVATFLVYTIANYHYTIKLNKLRIMQEEQELGLAA